MEGLADGVVLAAHPDGRIEVAAQGLQTPVGAVELPSGELMVSNIAGGISLGTLSAPGTLTVTALNGGTISVPGCQS